MAKISNILPSTETIEQIIEKYKIDGKDKTNLMAYKQAFSDRYSDRDGVLIQMSHDDYKDWMNAKKEISELKTELEKLKTNGK